IACRYWIARPLGDMYATRIVYYGFHFFRVLACFAFPLSWIGRFLEVVIQRLAGVQKTEQNEEEDLEEDIRSIVAEGHRDGFIEDEVRVMFDRIMQLDDAQVSTIMTPRTEIQSLSRDANWQEMLDFVNETQLSRIPVFGEDRDDIIGILFSKDLLLHLGPSGTPALNWTEYLHPPVFVPETKQINILLQEFLKSQNHFAIVLDEYGGVSGLVTLEDILEQIVGEIADETDDVPPEEIHLAEDGSAEVLGRVHIDEINTRLGTELSTEGDFETIGGFILTQLGRVPAIGEEIEADGVRLVVEEATARRVEKVRIILSSEDEGEIS
ncbi:MAG: HlyC/CorC family transporter, partial [Thermoguttaceae bacterium]|nr:HlyC/CorC family transporter [Thermoguttaceae bacterium]